METIKAPICDECPRKPECTFMCEERLDQFVREEELASIDMLYKFFFSKF